MSADSARFIQAGGNGDKNKNKQHNGQCNTESQCFDGILGCFLIFMLNQVKQSGTKTDNYQEKGNYYDAFDDHDSNQVGTENFIVDDS